MMNCRSLTARLRAAFVFFSIAFLLSLQPVVAQTAQSKPKNIIILFADGATNSQYEFGRYSSAQLRQQPFAVTDVVMARGHYQLMKTESANYFVTDSAAAASAMSTGYKVNNGAISITPDGKSPPTLMQIAKQNGKRIGLISTAPIYDASPAAFSVHAKSRRDNESIVNQYVELVPDVLMGGGLNFFLPKTVAGGKRQDDQNIVEIFKAKGYQYISTPVELNLVRNNKLLGLFAEEDIDYEIDRNPQEMPNLAQMVTTGLKVLNAKQAKDKGFVLFAENENTDSAGHQNDVAALMRDLWAFDDAVKVALEFQKQNPDTLIIVTGDHETGGFSPTYGRKNLGPAGPSNYQNVTPNQLKQIERYTMSLNKFFEKFKATVKQGASSSELKTSLDKLLQEGFPGLVLEDDLREKILNSGQLEPNSNYLPSNILALAIARQTGFYWGTSGHTPTPITVAAIGPGSQVFKGVDDNTAFAAKLRQLIGQK
ncbi:alkaline phosphatase [Polynucleobacter sp. AP-Titi-500A-B4]|uniref:alkaline phosphatase n=1 Tax=Polynucleobacter sp. AP-Titi-500A-B4 TaxID=2576923 RepID=UPI001BFE323B|nr:alkaline phosphatase [Polynucleobacter sp. AP-Titi-500A-B4]QWE11587.1 alkaline phosphatase [Polynucleobacter sp. AP-Titi-500A-B4]